MVGVPLFKSDGDVPNFGTSPAKKAVFDGNLLKNGTSPSLAGRRMRFLLMPVAVDFADVAGRDKALDLVVADIGHQVGELVLGQQGLDLKALFAAVAAHDGIEAAAAMELFNDMPADQLMILGNDADAFLAVEAGREVVDGQAVDPGTDQTENDQMERVDGESGAADDGAGHGDGSTDIEMEILVDDLRENVQTARGGVDTEHDGLRETQHQHEADHIEERLAHHGRGTFGDESLGGADDAPQIDHRTENHGGIDGLGAEFLADQQPGQHQQEGVDRHDDDGHLPAGDAGDDQRQTGDGTDDQVRRHHEIVDGSGGDHHTDRHDNEFFPEFPLRERRKEVGHSVINRFRNSKVTHFF